MKGALLAIALTLTPTAAWAACAAADLRGTWDAYVFGSEPSGTYLLRCVLRLNAAGLLRSPSRCTDASTLAGRFTIGQNCRFTAALTQRFGPGELYRLGFVGTLANGKDDFAATGRSDVPGIMIVNAIKR